jgi:hypothetical protein
MFVNISNHPANKWSPAQIANAGGQVRDIQFPNVAPMATTAEVAKLADDLADQVAEGEMAMVQGEFSLTYALTRRLRARGILVVVACTERKVTEVQKEGKTEKVVVFEFLCFREVE